MESKKIKTMSLAQKTAAVLSAALVALTGSENRNFEIDLQNESNSNIIQLKEITKSKPMPVLKLNPYSVEDSQFVASHASHRSHSSHRSHYSHRSGAMFS
jgi:hypothetical protein